MFSSKFVFISFKTQERDVAFKLKTALNNKGYNVWWQEEIQCGQEWHGEIDKAIDDAGAVVVLWSEASMDSTWVKHEASQAMSRDIYAPVRIQLMEIDNPYNRVQATDIINWSGDENHPGFQNLLVRLRELLPSPITQVAKFLYKHLAVVVLLAIAFVAIYLLLKQGKAQDETFKNVKKQTAVLNSQASTLESQLKKQDELIKNGRGQRDLLNKQLEQQSAFSSNLVLQSKTLKLQIIEQARQSSNTIENINKVLYPLFPMQIQGSATVKLSESSHKKITELFNAFGDRKEENSRLPYGQVEWSGTTIYYNNYTPYDTNTYDREFRDLNEYIFYDIFPQLTIRFFKDKVPKYDSDENASLIIKSYEWSDKRGLIFPRTLECRYDLDLEEKTVQFNFSFQPEYVFNPSKINSIYSCMNGEIEIDVSYESMEAVSQDVLSFISFNSGINFTNRYLLSLNKNDINKSGSYVKPIRAFIQDYQAPK